MSLFLLGSIRLQIIRRDLLLVVLQHGFRFVFNSVFSDFIHRTSRVRRRRSLLEWEGRISKIGFASFCQFLAKRIPFFFFAKRDDFNFATSFDITFQIYL